MAAAAELLGDPEVERDRLGVAEVEVSVRLGREARHDLRDSALAHIGGDDLADEIASFGRGRIAALTRLLLVISIRVVQYIAMSCCVGGSLEPLHHLFFHWIPDLPPGVLDQLLAYRAFFILILGSRTGGVRTASGTLLSGRIGQQDRLDRIVGDARCLEILDLRSMP